MSAAEDEMIAALHARDTARAALEERLAVLRDHLADHGIGERVRHDAASRAKGVAEEAFDVAVQSRWVIGATLLVLVAWLLRNPIVAGARRAANRLSRREPRVSWHRFRDWTVRKAKL